MIGTWKQHSSKMTITCRYWWIENLTAKAISHKDLDFFCKTSCLLKTQNWGLEKRKQIYCSLHESYLALLDTLVVRGAPPERHGFSVGSVSSAARPSQTSQFCWGSTNFSDDAFHSCLFSHMGLFFSICNFNFTDWPQPSIAQLDMKNLHFISIPCPCGEGTTGHNYAHGTEVDLLEVST